MSMASHENARESPFTALLEGILDPAYRTAYHLTNNKDDAEELVQEASLAAYRAFHRFEQGTNFKAWFLTILRNRFISDYRKQKRRPAVVELDEVSDEFMWNVVSHQIDSGESADPARYIVDRLDTEQVISALAALPDEFREVCTLYFTQDLQYQEISDILDVPIGTVRSRIHRGRRLLKQRLWRLAEDRGLLTG